MKSFMAEFKEFLNKGNFVEFAAAIVLGLAVKEVVTSIVDGFIGPLIAAIFGNPSLGDSLTFTINDATFSIGTILDGLLNFVIVALVVFMLVRIVNRIMKKADPGPTTEDLLAEIRDLMKSQQSGPGSSTPL
jgi:large conductance mechanosensitive channel